MRVVWKTQVAHEAFNGLMDEVAILLRHGPEDTETVDKLLRRANALYERHTEARE